MTINNNAAVASVSTQPNSSNNNTSLKVTPTSTGKKPMTEKDKDSNAHRLRENQRRSRLRKKEYLASLEARFRDCQRTGIEASVEIQQAAKRVVRENQRLRELLRLQRVTDSEIETWVRTGDPANADDQMTAVEAVVKALRRRPCTGEPLDMGPNIISNIIPSPSLTDPGRRKSTGMMALDRGSNVQHGDQPELSPASTSSSFSPLSPVASAPSYVVSHGIPLHAQHTPSYTTQAPSPYTTQAPASAFVDAHHNLEPVYGLHSHHSPVTTTTAATVIPAYSTASSYYQPAHHQPIQPLQSHQPHHHHHHQHQHHQQPPQQQQQQQQSQQQQQPQTQSQHTYPTVTESMPAMDITRTMLEQMQQQHPPPPSMRPEISNDTTSGPPTLVPNGMLYEVMNRM